MVCTVVVSWRGKNSCLNAVWNSSQESYRGSWVVCSWARALLAKAAARPSFRNERAHRMRIRSLGNSAEQRFMYREHEFMNVRPWARLPSKSLGLAGAGSLVGTGGVGGVG